MNTKTNDVNGVNGVNGVEEGKDEMPPPPPPPYKLTHQSPIPERKHISKEKEEERRESSVRNYSPQVIKKILIPMFMDDNWDLSRLPFVKTSV